MGDQKDRDFNEMEKEDRDLHEMDEPEDSEFRAFRTGHRAFAAVASDWTSLRIDRRLGRRDRDSQIDADDIAQSVARGLLRYLSRCPAEDSSKWAGEVFRGIFYGWMSAGMQWNPYDLDTMSSSKD